MREMRVAPSEPAVRGRLGALHERGDTAIIAAPKDNNPGPASLHSDPPDALAECALPHSVTSAPPLEVRARLAG